MSFWRHHFNKPKPPVKPRTFLLRGYRFTLSPITSARDFKMWIMIIILRYHHKKNVSKDGGDSSCCVPSTFPDIPRESFIPPSELQINLPLGHSDIKTFSCTLSNTTWLPLWSSEEIREWLGDLSLSEWMVQNHIPISVSPADVNILTCPYRSDYCTIKYTRRHPVNRNVFSRSLIIFSVV